MRICNGESTCGSGSGRVAEWLTQVMQSTSVRPLHGSRPCEALEPNAGLRYRTCVDRCLMSPVHFLALSGVAVRLVFACIWS